MRVSTLVWGLLLILAGVLLATDWIPGADGFAVGPRVGMVVALLSFGLLVLAIPLSQWYLRKTTRPEDYQGRCPVGRVCPSCEAFNFFPRTTCRGCGFDMGPVPDGKENVSIKPDAQRPPDV